MHTVKIVILTFVLVTTLSACESLYRENIIYGDEGSVPIVYAKVETTPVASLDDAADDPAIWYNVNNPEESLILGTDKQSGLAIYTLDGQQKQFIPAGLPNNVDLRQGLKIDNWQGDLAAASNRDGDVVTLFSMTATGGSMISSFPAGLVEPYGSCMGIVSGRPVVFVTYKTGEVQAHVLKKIRLGNIEQELIGTISFTSQLEGCVHDDDSGTLYVGEEERGLWMTKIGITNETFNFSPPTLIDDIVGTTGIAADIEGVALYKNNDNSYVIASSQGNDSYAVYKQSDQQFIGRFRIANNPATGIDGSQETDGIEVDSRYFGDKYPEGILVVQDGYNAPVGEAQNFKIIDWRDIKKALTLH
ncbi:MAG: phytase [Cellvibrionaceae bacterium]